MAPPSKAIKSDVTLKVYNLTRDLRRSIDAADRLETDAKIQELNEALAKGRELVKYLTDKVGEKLALAGGSDTLVRTLNTDARRIATEMAAGRAT